MSLTSAFAFVRLILALRRQENASRADTPLVKDGVEDYREQKAGADGDHAPQRKWATSSTMCCKSGLQVQFY